MTDSKIRHIPAQVVRTREATNDQGEAEGIVEGYSAIYEESYRVWADLTETIGENAFAESIKERGGVVPLFWAHGWQKSNDTPIGHALVREDKTGLHTEAHLYIEEPRVRSLFQAVEAGAIREWSIGFIARQIETTRTDDGEDERIVDGELIETSLAVKGMNPGTFVTSTRDDDLEGAGDPSAEGDEPTGTEGDAQGGDAEGDPDEGATTDDGTRDADEGAAGSADSENEDDGAAGGKDAPGASDDVEAREQVFAALRNPAMRALLREQLAATSE